MTLPAIRFFGTVTEAGDPWGDPAFQFYTALRERGFTIRVVAHGMAYLSGGRWSSYWEDLSRAPPLTFVNVMCLPVPEIGIALTVDVKNVAITRWPEAGMKKDEIAIVDCCDLVVVPPEDMAKFAEAEIDARTMSPFQVAQVLAGF